MELDPLNSAPRRVEAYLDQVLAPLTRSLSAFHQQELRRELRAHLWERISAYQELGMIEDEAVTEALCQFGGAEDFLRQWRREWIKMPAQRLTLHSVYEAGRSALRPLLIGLAAAQLAFSLFNGLCWNLYERGGAFIGDYGTDIGWVFSAVVFLMLPALIGVVSERQTPYRGGLGLFAAISALTVTSSTLYCLGASAGLDRTEAGDAVASLTLMAMAWMPVACASAVLSGWWMRRLKARQLA
jgi:hypothetical protein